MVHMNSVQSWATMLMLFVFTCLVLWLLHAYRVWRDEHRSFSPSTRATALVTPAVNPRVYADAGTEYTIYDWQIDGL
jgi:hypothetical protein